ncbi:tRNA ligase class I, catalytic domain protein [Cooperia oncophora]
MWKKKWGNALLRKDAVRRNEVPKYDKKCRSIDDVESRTRADAGEPFVIRFKLDKQNVSFEDEIFGSVDQCIDESDMVLLKSDGFPTYHLANIVDDREMHISHVIRGMEWLSSTGKHVLLYNAFGWSAPKWLHLPLITRDGKKKLSKRDKDAYVDFYEQELGALPTAVLNLLIRNGSGIRDFDTAHLYSLEEMIANFDEHCIGRRNLQVIARNQALLQGILFLNFVFQLDHETLDRYGRMAFQMSDFETELLPALHRLIKQDLPNIPAPDVAYLKMVTSFLKANEENFAFLSTLTKGDFRWFLTKPMAAERLLSVCDRQTALAALSYLQECESLDAAALKVAAEQHGWAYTKLLAIIRVTLIDNTKGPPVKELVSFFGLDECRKRFKDMIDYLHSSPEAVLTANK